MSTKEKGYHFKEYSDLDLLIHNHIVMELEQDKANNNGKPAYGAISEANSAISNKGHGQVSSMETQ
jgi:hypothetical protein